MSEKKRIYVIFDHSADMLTFSEIKSSCNAEDCGNYFYTIDYSDDYNNEIKANHCRCRNGFRNNKHCVSANFKHLLKNQIGSFRNFRYKFEQH